MGVYRGGEQEKIGINGHRHCTPIPDKKYGKKMGGNENLSLGDIKEYVHERRKNTFFTNNALVILFNARVTGGKNRDGVGYRKDILESIDSEIIFMGGNMEMVGEELKIINEQVSESKKILQTVLNESRAVFDQLEPELRKQVAAIRMSRITTLGELSQTLTMLKDVRKFFLDENYEKEIGRLKEFVSLCAEIKKLKETGFFDAVCDSALSLSLKERAKK